jgi:hypothetical protein
MERYQPKGKLTEINKRLKYLADAVEITERGERNGRLIVASGDFSDFRDGNWFYWRFEPEEEL